MLSNQLLQDGIVTGNSDVFHIRNPVVLQLFENQNLSECLVFYSPTTVIGACSVHPLSFSCFLLLHYTYHMPSNMFYIRLYISYNKYISQWNHIKFQQHFSKLFIIQFSVPILEKTTFHRGDINRENLRHFKTSDKFRFFEEKNSAG